MMVTYKLNSTGDMAGKHIDSIATGEWVNIKSNEVYLAWLAEGGIPQEADDVSSE